MEDIDLQILCPPGVIAGSTFQVYMAGCGVSSLAVWQSLQTSNAIITPVSQFEAQVTVLASSSGTAVVGGVCFDPDGTQREVICEIPIFPPGTLSVSNVSEPLELIYDSCGFICSVATASVSFINCDDLVASCSIGLVYRDCDCEDTEEECNPLV